MSENYDIIFISGEVYYDHPMSGVAILKRVLEKKGFTVAVITPNQESDVLKYGKPNLYFAVSSGSMDSMLRNYTPLKRRREDDPHNKYEITVPDRATILFCNWIRKNFKGSKLVIGGVEASLRRFTHYDYWDNKLRRSILNDTRADILSYGSSEKQMVEISERIRDEKPLTGIKGTCVFVKEIPTDIKVVELPSHDEVINSKESFCDMQNLFSNYKNLIQKVDNRYILQYEFPNYTSKDLDEIYEMPFDRMLPRELRGFEFSVVTHRGCYGNCGFCAIHLLHGHKIISRSEDSIIREINYIADLPHFQGNIDDLGGPSVNMYGTDCDICDLGNCLNCPRLNKNHERLIKLLKRAREVKGVNHVYVKSGIRYDLATDEYLKELIEYHTFDTLRIAPEHTDPKVLKLMNKNYGNLNEFIKKFDRICSENKIRNKDLSYYFITGHPGSSMKEAKQLGADVKKLQNAESVQLFTPTPMSTSTCMYYTGLDPKTKKEIYVPYSYNEKKVQKRLCYPEESEAGKSRNYEKPKYNRDDSNNKSYKKSVNSNKFKKFDKSDFKNNTYKNNSNKSYNKNTKFKK